MKLGTGIVVALLSGAAVGMLVATAITSNLPTIVELIVGGGLDEGTRSAIGSLGDQIGAAAGLGTAVIIVAAALVAQTPRHEAP